MRILTWMIASTLLTAASAAGAEKTWRETLHEQLPLLGHRNWVIVADSAFPLQIAPGVETIYTGEDQLTVLNAVLRELGSAKHVSPVVYLDAEIEHVPEKDAPGIDAYKTALSAALGDRKVQHFPHEEVLRKIDQTGKMFKILMLKTNLTVPYTSVFLELDCGYWGPEQEKAMRAAMSAVAAKTRESRPQPARGHRGRSRKDRRLRLRVDHLDQRPDVPERK